MLTPVDVVLRLHILAYYFSDLLLERWTAGNLLDNTTKLGADVLEEAFHMIRNIAKCWRLVSQSREASTSISRRIATPDSGSFFFNRSCWTSRIDKGERLKRTFGKD